MKTVKIQAIALALSILFSVGAYAQEFHYGVHAGTNFAVQSDIADYFDNDQIRTGLHAGVFGNMALTDMISLQTEINYNQKGAKSNNVTSKYDYISVPLLAKFSLGKSNLTALRFNINVGPYASYLVNAEIDNNGVITDVKDTAEDFEAGAILGFGMKYPVAKNNLVFDLRLGLGLTDFDKTNEAPNNKYIGVSLGYEF